MTKVTFWQQLPLLVVLVVLWMLLWGSFSWLNLVTGILLAVIVTRVFYLPAVELAGRFNIIWFVVSLVRFVVDLVVASFQVAFRAFAPKSVTSNAVIGVELVSRSDFIMTVTAIAVSLIPGSIVVEADRDGGILYLHVLGVRDIEAVEKARATVLDTEAQIIRAMGSREDKVRCER